MPPPWVVAEPSWLALVLTVLAWLAVPSAVPAAVTVALTEAEGEWAELSEAAAVRLGRAVGVLALLPLAE